MGYQVEKKIVREYFDELEKCSPEQAKDVLKKYMAEDYFWEGPYPYLDKNGIEVVAEEFWKPLKTAFTRMQRRQDVFIAGVGLDGVSWVMSMGQFVGNFEHDLLGIRHTNKMAHLQYCEYSHLVDGKIAHTAMFVDYVGLMMEAGVYPLTPMFGNYFVYPGPRDHNGLLFIDADPAESAETFRIVKQMNDEIDEVFFPEVVTFVDQETTYKMLQATWAEDMTWYGPCGIGAGYTIKGYMRHHHCPFEEGLTDVTFNDMHAYFAEGAFATYFTSLQTTARGSWIGLPGGTKDICMRGDIDIYYVKDGKISENWCFIDIPYWLSQQGIDIFERTAAIMNS